MRSGQSSAIPRRNLFRLAGTAATASALLSATGCGLLGGSEGATTSNDKVEKANLKLGALPTTEVAPLHLAKERGHFDAEGLTEVEIINASDGSAALNSTIGGDYDISFSSYMPVFKAQSEGAADLRIVSDCASLSPQTTQIMAAPDAGIESPQDLAGARIAISGPGTISELLAKAALQTRNVDFSGVEWAPLGFANMPSALAQNSIDAGILTEPFITLAARDANAQQIIDVGTGPLESFPMGCYVATAQFAKDNPRTVQAFQRAMLRSTMEAQDRSNVEPLLPQYAKIEPETAKIIGLLDYESRADPRRIARVPRLMRQFGYLNEEIDVSKLIIDQPKN
ncbi:ABC transporter substrate-binding protein [Bounagaea algeriensis]